MSNRSWCCMQVVNVLIKANDIWNLDLDVPSIDFYSKGKVAGTARCISWRLEFNEILMDENKDSFIQTIIHEVAHLVTHKLYPNAKQNHGPEFKYVITKLGGEAKTYHNYDVSNVPGKKQQRHQYKCVGCGKVMQISTTLHNRLHRDVVYRTRCCAVPLTRFNWVMPE